MDEQQTQPTIETLMQIISAFQTEMREGFRQVGERFDALEKRFDALEKRFDALEKEVRDGFRRLERKQDVLNQSILEIRGDLRYMDERITALEQK
jgi:hypothetical protein